MQTFARVPSGPELALLLAPDSRCFRVRTEDVPDRFTARPSGGILLPWCIFWLAVPHLALGWHLWDKAHRWGLEPVDCLGILLACFEAPLLLCFFWWLNHREISKGEFFRLDKRDKTLTLSRLGYRFEDRQIVCFVEVRAWHSTTDSEGTGHLWLGELTVLTRGEQNAFNRYPVLTSLHIGAVSKISKKLADHFGVELRRLILDRKTRRRLAESVEQC
jgi:hypothetical protein